MSEHCLDLDPVTRFQVASRHRLHSHYKLNTLVPGNMWGQLTWVIAQSFADSPHIEILNSSADFNPAVTALVRKMQSEADHRARNPARAEGSNAISLALFLSLALDVGGKNLMRCTADSAQSRLIVDTLQTASDAVLAGSPPSEELAWAKERLKGLDCGFLEDAA